MTPSTKECNHLMGQFERTSRTMGEFYPDLPLWTILMWVVRVLFWAKSLSQILQTWGRKPKKDKIRLKLYISWGCAGFVYTLNIKRNVGYQPSPNRLPNIIQEILESHTYLDIQVVLKYFRHANDWLRQKTDCVNA